MPADVVLYTTPICPYCVRAKLFLFRKGVSFREIDVDGDDAKRAWLREASGQRTVPQIFVNGRSIGGCDDMLALDRRGGLDALLAEEPPAGGARLG